MRTTIEKKSEIEALRKEAAELATGEILVETNSGTYGDYEALKCVGVGDPRYADYRVYARIGDGRERVEGCNRDEAPGVARRINRDLLCVEQKRLREIRAKIKELSL